METVEISKTEHDRLVALEAKLEGEKTRADEAERKVEQTEADKVKVEGERDTLKTEKEALEETARQTTLRDERINALGKGFMDALGKTESIKTRVEAQAKDMSDEDWTARLDELEELLGKKRDDAGDGDDGNGNPSEETAEEFTAADLSKLTAGANGNGDAAVSPAARRSTVGALAGAFGKKS